MKKHYIIPVFVPHRGCPHACVFCNQSSITGQKAPVDGAAVQAAIKSWLGTIPTGADKTVEVAFYGGSFTGIPLAEQSELLAPAARAIATGQIDGIRLSTRPDYIGRDILDNLLKYRVGTIELGVQSLAAPVLAAARRGHSAAMVSAAVSLIRRYGFILGLQLMIGLPADTPAQFRETVRQTIALQPDFVRIYPTLVLKGTELADMYREGRYVPLTLPAAIEQAKEALGAFRRAGIPVIRVGLQPTEDIAADAQVLAGPFHPSFRQLVESAMFRDAFAAAAREHLGAKTADILVNPKEETAARGRKNGNLAWLRKNSSWEVVNLHTDAAVPLGEIRLASIGGKTSNCCYRVADYC
ncbi:MAG: elongator complex protein 3 [bacterium]